MDLRRHCARSTTAGSLVWLVWVAFAGQGLLVDLFVLSPLVIAPLILRRVLGVDGLATSAIRLAIVGQLPAALVATLSFLLAPGWLAAAATLPWMAVTFAIAIHATQRLQRRGRPGPASALSIDAGLGYVVIGAGWWSCSRLGWAPLGFADLIVFLTAVHFHFAGFCLPVLGGLGAARLSGRSASAAALGVVAGVPLVAAGITFAPALELSGALVTASGAFVIGVGQLRLALALVRVGGGRRSRGAAALLALSGLSVMFAMVVAAAYGIGEYLQRPWPSIPQMIPLHGAVNALGFCLLGMWGWNLECEEHARGTEPATDQ